METSNVSRISTKVDERKGFLVNYPDWAHTELRYWCTDYELLRDAFNGERDIKEKTKAYLPQSSGMTDKEYVAYLDRASYFNMTGRTVSGLVGSLFKRAPVISNWPKRFDKHLKNISKHNGTLRGFMKTCAQEQFAVGRYGVLVDREPSSDGKSHDPYLTGYVAENILAWETGTVEGRERLVSLVLRETTTVSEFGKASTSSLQYRHLYLGEHPEYPGEWVYIQDLYINPEDGDAQLTAEQLSDQAVPTRHGKPFTTIPFVFFGQFSNNSEIEKPPILDIARLNISHYRSSAQLEHGRFYTGNPIYFVQVGQSAEAGKYTIGPSVVWEVGQGERPGIIEFNGQGLKFLENGLSQKEAQISSLGGRMVGIQTQAVSESDNQVAMKEKNERTMLMNISQVVDDGFTELLGYWLWWSDASDAEIDKLDEETNKDFLLENIRAREVRAVQSL